ncbi:sensor histidine kinase [Paenibacillus sp. HB172176]|uniref:cache domain-containing sensor histidine kinase n=1 Tax=Paenibacillus sp. HB172176 TaxID=2493690 RepID=UPI00143B6746|nr:sensor histidine kinase [Paenibacillus sp. HB172176]
MRRLIDRFSNYRLFIKMFIIMVVSIVAVSVATTWATINMSGRVFMDTFSITNSKVIAQINSNLNNFNYSIVVASNRILQSGAIRGFLTQGDGDSLSNYKSYYNMTQQMEQIYSSLDAYDVSLLVTGINGRSYVSDRSIWSISDQELREHEVTANTLADPRKLLFQYAPSDPDRAGSQGVIVASKALMDRTDNEIYGVMYFAITERTFQRFYNSFTSKGNDVAILSGDGSILSSNKEDWIGKPAPELLGYAKDIQQNAMTYKEVELEGRKGILLSSYLSPYDLYLVNVVDKETAVGQLMDTRTIILIVIVIVALSLMIMFLVSRQLTKSLTRLVKQISTISKYEFDHHVSVDGSYETRQIGLAFNDMLGELQDYVKELVETQKGQRNAELEALQQQINPHFLYNTLASVKFMVQQGSRERAAETINALISLLQNAIGNVSETIPLSQELVNLRNYVYINHIRYGERIKMNYFVSPDCLGCHVPKLIIQPFIENAFFHGFNEKAEGQIYFMASLDADALVCEVADNGDGFLLTEDEDAHPLSPKSKRQLFAGIGMKNVHDRIKLLYGDSYGVTIASEPGEGTKVKIRLPVIFSQK